MYVSIISKKFKLEYVERENMFPSYILSISILNTLRVSFVVCIFNRDLFCELNLAGVLSGIYLSPTNNSSSIPDYPIFPLCCPSEVMWSVKVWLVLFVSCIASITAFEHTFILLLHLLPSRTFILERTMHITFCSLSFWNQLRTVIGWCVDGFFCMLCFKILTSSLF